uniref:NTR domain-containing protein n=1 Tax=Macrostomum lignano TaxID=282301 RepID=A0A1I8JB30_9PLAT
MDYAESLKIGAIVYLHEREVYPVDIGNGLRLSPGTQSFVHVKVKQTVYQRDCLAATPELLDLYISGRQWRVKYTTDLCTYLGRHDTYKEVCNCSMSCLPHSQPDEHTDDAAYPPCLKQNLTPSSKGLDLTHLTCLMQLDGKLLPKRESSKPRCDPLCTQVGFTVARSEAKGIDANSALDFFQRYVFNTSAHRLM